MKTEMCKRFDKEKKNEMGLKDVSFKGEATEKAFS